MKRLTRFFAELRRRRVFRMAAWYGTVAWLLIQFAATVFPNLDLPAWSTKFVIVATLMGFPVALLLAWTFQLSFEGLARRTEPTAADSAQFAESPWRSASLWLALAAGTILGVASVQAWRAYTQGEGESAP